VSDVIYEAIGGTPSDLASFIMVVVAMVQAVLLIPALVTLYRPCSCLAASIGDKPTVGYLDQVSPDGLVSALQIWREGDHS
jgi:hypothetical protein